MPEKFLPDFIKSFASAGDFFCLGKVFFWNGVGNSAASAKAGLLDNNPDYTRRWNDDKSSLSRISIGTSYLRLRYGLYTAYLRLIL